MMWLGKTDVYAARCRDGLAWAYRFHIKPTRSDYEALGDNDRLSGDRPLTDAKVEMTRTDRNGYYASDVWIATVNLDTSDSLIILTFVFHQWYLITRTMPTLNVI